MQAESELIEQGPNTSRRMWWVLVLVAVIAGLIYFAASDCTSTVLTDGTRVYYRGYVRGEALPHSEFEEALYGYPSDLLHPRNIMDRLYNTFHGGADAPVYCHAPLLLKVRAEASGGGSFQGSARLQDDFGASHQLNSGLPPLFYNNEAMPRRSPWLAFRFEASSGGASGILKFRNPYYHPTADFVGQPTPLSATTSAGTVQLRRAVWRNLESDSPNWPSVLLEFDVSQCSDLLPCHVIGVRITDCWGNSELVDGSLDKDGRTVRAVWEPIGLSRATLQDSNWRVRLALCRGLGAQVPLSRVAVFESVRMDDHHFTGTKAAGSQQVRLEQFSSSEKRSGAHGRRCFATVELPGASLDDWPILVGVTGHLEGGGSEVFDPNKDGKDLYNDRKEPHKDRKETYLDQARPRRTVISVQDGPAIPVTTPTFKVRYSVPATYESVDLRFAIERPEVFQFDVQVADWPLKFKN